MYENKYFIYLFEDYTKFSWVLFIKLKLKYLMHFFFLI